MRHIVYTSFVGAAPDAVFTLGRDHYWTEEHIKEAGLSYTFLRNNFYIDFMDALVGENLTIRGPAGDGKVSVVAREDIARVAAAVLRDPGTHRDATYYMTGPEALSMVDVARALTLARGETVTFHDETVPEAYESRRRWGAPDWQNDAWVSTYTAIASGDLAAVSDDVETVTGADPSPSPSSSSPDPMPDLLANIPSATT